VIVIVAREQDEAARLLVERWQHSAAALMTPRDLSRRGWVHRCDAPLRGRAVVSGAVVPVSEIAGVVTLLGAVHHHDVPYIVDADRSYVASEMRAFLLAWLDTLPCRMLNRPTPMSLSGCGWTPERWGLAAAALGIPTAPISGPRPAVIDLPDAVEVTYVGGRTFDAPSPRVAGWVRGLASVANSATLTARFVNGAHPRLQSVSVVPDLARAEVADAALHWLDPVAA
jgi:hypothetical protein